MKKHPLFNFIFASLSILCAKLIPFNWIIGSIGLKFSLSSIAAPLIAHQFGLAFVTLFLMSPKLISSFNILSSSGIYLPLALFFIHRLPLFCAGYAFQKKGFLTSFIIPASCMILFISHDIGQAAWVYSLYWLIPMITYFATDSSFNRSLTASFIAHAVGSVVWLYCCTPIAPSVWIALIPMVALERLLITFGIFYGDKVIGKISDKFNKKITPTSPSLGLTRGSSNKIFLTKGSIA